ncbi:MAG: CDP-glycerol glycerophosphotransferase family protein [Microbacteriaceae bacterium]
MSDAFNRLATLAPEVVVVWPETIAYSQLQIWESYFAHSTATIAIIARNHAGKPRLESSVPTFFEDEDVFGIADLAALKSIKVVLYPTVRVRFRKFINALADRVHVFIGHGDSDKASSSRSSARIFDAIFVADQAAENRYPTNRMRSVEFVQIGAPLMDGLVAGARASVPTKILYAPTWEGYSDENNYSSLATVAAHLESVCAGREVRVMPHPGTGKRLASSKDALGVISGRLGDNGDMTKVDLFNWSDAMVTDISGVMSEYLATRKPIVLVNPGTEAFGSAIETSTMRAAVSVWNPAIDGFESALATAAGAELTEARTTAADLKYRGAKQSSDAWREFDSALHRMIATASAGQSAVRIARKRLFKKNPITAAKAVARFILRRPNRPRS